MLSWQPGRKRKTQHHGENGIVHVSRHSVILYSMDTLSFEDSTEETVKQKREVLRRFSEHAIKSYATCQPTADHLLRLIRLNVINSLTQNSVVLGLKVDWLICSSKSPFGVHGPDELLAACPVNLVPTRLQRSIPHHPWVDLLPLPQMRDNFLLAITQRLSWEEEQQLWKDLLESGGHTDWTGMIVWGEPWDSWNWEVTAHFMRRWGWLLDGCDEIFEATNCWRRQRSERPFRFEAPQRTPSVFNIE